MNRLLVVSALLLALVGANAAKVDIENMTPSSVAYVD